MAVNNSSGTPIAVFGYDASGRRITEVHGDASTDLYYSNRWQVIDSVTITPTTVVDDRYYWSVFYVDQLVAREEQTVYTDDSEESSARGSHTNALGSGDLISLYTRLYAHQDANYNTTSISNSSGTVVERDRYSAYGTVTFMSASGGTLTASGYSWIILHQGLRRDTQTNTDDDRNRITLVGLGRFGQEDPSGYADGSSRYQREQSNPCTSVDPFGLDTTVTAGGADQQKPSGSGSNSTVKSASGAADGASNTSSQSQRVQACKVGTWAMLTDPKLMIAMMDASGQQIHWNGESTVYEDAFSFQEEMLIKYGDSFKGNEQGLQEAARHMYWQAELTRKYGADIATKIGDLHEVGQIEAGQEADSARDQAHNCLGRKLGSMSTSSEESKALAEEAIRSGQAFLDNPANPAKPLPLLPKGPLPLPSHVMPKHFAH